MNTTETDLIFERYTQTKILPQYNEGVISNVVKSVAAKFDDAAVKKLIGAVNDSTAIEVIIELDKMSPKKRANLHRAITSWIERNSNNAAVKQLTRLQTSLKESTDLEEASKADIKKVLTAAKKAGGTIKGNQIDFGMGAVIDVSIEKGKIKLDAGQSNGVELFDNVKDAIMAFESVDLEEAIVYRDIRIAIELLKTTPDAIKFRNLIAKKDQDAKISASDLKKAKEVFANPNDKDKANIEKKRKDRYFPRFGVKALEEESTEDLEEATMSQGVKTAATQIYSLEKSLKVGSNLNKGINKSLEGKYDADFKKMQKAIGDIITVWEEIERDFSDINEATDFEKTNTLTSDEYDEVKNFQNFNKKDWRWLPKQDIYTRKKKV